MKGDGDEASGADDAEVSGEDKEDGDDGSGDATEEEEDGEDETKCEENKKCQNGKFGIILINFLFYIHTFQGGQFRNLKLNPK